MPLIISDDTLKAAGLTEREALLEFACAMFDAQKLSKFAASRLVGMSRDQFDDELRKRGLPVYRYTEEHFRQDMDALEKLRSLEPKSR